jgi:hypothetical protein
MGIVNFSEFLFEKGDKSEKKDTSEDKDKSKKEISKWEENWSIPVDPDVVSPLLENSELCLRSSLACIKQISSLVQNDKKLDQEISNIEDKISEIDKLRQEYISEEGSEKNGKLYSFWESYNERKEKGGKTSTDELIKEGSGMTGKSSSEYLNKLRETRDLIIKCKSLADSGQMTSKEWEANVRNYSKDVDNRSVKTGEGLKSVMYAEIKDAFSFLQSAIDNYCASEGKNALDEYIKTYEGFIEDYKSDYGSI